MEENEDLLNENDSVEESTEEIEKEDVEMAGNTETATVQTAIKRSQYANMLKINDKFIRMGKGISEFKKGNSAEKETNQWINQDSPTTEIDHYSSSYDTTLKCYKNEPLFEFLYPLARQLPTGSSAHVTLAEVFIFDGENGSYPADVHDATISFGDVDYKEIAFTLDLNGDKETGTMAIDSTTGEGTFTKASS